MSDAAQPHGDQPLPPRPEDRRLRPNALVAARNGDAVDESDPNHFDYRYVGPVEEVVPDGER